MGRVEYNEDESQFFRSFIQLRLDFFAVLSVAMSFLRENRTKT